MKSINIKRNGIDIGKLVYDLTDEENGMGEVKDINIPADPHLELNIRLHLDNNPDALSISGGHAPDDIGSYTEGVVNVLRYLMNEYNFDIDLTDFPVYTPPEDLLA